MNKSERFTDLIRKHEGLIFKITRAYANDATDQKDLYQEIVYQLWKSFDSFRSESKITTWMYRIALNTSLTFNARSYKKMKSTQLDFDVIDEVNESLKLKNEKISLLYEKINGLNAMDKGIVLLFLEGRSHHDISEIMGISKSNVGTKLNRIKQKLKSQILNNPS